jgi:hypothetical protein
MYVLSVHLNPVENLDNLAERFVLADHRYHLRFALIDFL